MRLILALLVVVFLSGANPAPWDIDEIVGKKAPDFMLKDMSGANVSLSAYKGRVVLINFWATWCPPCRAEMPSLNKLYNEYKARGLVVLAISTDRSASPVKEFLSKNRFDFPVLLDTDGRVSKQFKVFSMPTSFLIDKNGVILKRYLGEEDWTSPEIKKELGEVF